MARPADGNQNYGQNIYKGVFNGQQACGRSEPPHTVFLNSTKAICGDKIKYQPHYQLNVGKNQCKQAQAQVFAHGEHFIAHSPHKGVGDGKEQDGQGHIGQIGMEHLNNFVHGLGFNF